MDRPSDHPDALDGTFGDLLEAVLEWHLEGKGHLERARTTRQVENPSVPMVTERQSLGGLLRSVVRPLDILVLLSVPLVLIGAFTVPLEVRQALAFSYVDPTLLTAFTANFVHLHAGHLVANLVVYALVVPVVYLLSVLGGTRTRFYAVLTVFVLVFPVTLSIMNLAMARPGYTVGFSGVNMAFLGYLPVALASFLAVHFEVDRQLDLAAVLFLGGLAMIAVLSYQSAVTIGLAAFALGVAVLYALDGTQTDGSLCPDVRAAVEVPGFIELAVASVVLFAGLLIVAFPADPVVDAGMINLYVHLLGFALGFMVIYSTAVVASRLSEQEVSVTD